MNPFDKARYGELLKGLEISEIKLSALERTWRLDPEFYSKAHLDIAARLKTNSAVSLTEFADISDGNHIGVSDEFCAEGVPYFRGGDIKEFFLSFVHPEYCVPESIYAKPTMIRSHMKQGDVFVSIVGAIIGQIGMKTDEASALCSCKLGILRPKKHKTSAYIAAFLLSDVGQSQISRYRRGSAQTGLILDDFEQLLVPCFSDGFYLGIDKMVSAALKARQGSVESMKTAEEALLAELGLAGWTPTDEAISVKTYLDFLSAERFDAEYFQPKYDAIEGKIRGYRGGAVMASDALVAGLVNEAAETSERYVELADIGMSGEISGCTSATFGELPSRARQRMETGQVIVSSIEGSLDKCALVTSAFDKALCSTGFHRFRSTAINAETLLLLFKSWPIQQLMKRGCSGTILSAILPGELSRVPLPLVDPRRLLDLAKRAVETAIEQGEERAIATIEREAH